MVHWLISDTCSVTIMPPLAINRHTIKTIRCDYYLHGRGFLIPCMWQLFPCSQINVKHFYCPENEVYSAANSKMLHTACHQCLLLTQNLEFSFILHKVQSYQVLFHFLSVFHLINLKWVLADCILKLKKVIE